MKRLLHLDIRRRMKKNISNLYLTKRYLMRVGASLILLLFFVLPVFGQDSIPEGGWSLQQCISFAQDNNLSIRKSELAVETGLIDHQQTKYDVLPDLNGFASHGYNWGQTVDQFTNTFATERVRNNSFSLSSNITVFNGMQQYNQVRKTKFDLMARRYDVEKMKDDIAMNITTTYLQILFNKEIVAVTEEQVKQSERQVERMEKMKSAGQAAKGELLDMQSQLQNERLNLVKAQNNLKLSRLQLTQLLQLSGEAARNFEIEPPRIEDQLPEGGLSSRPQQVYQQAIEEMPAIKSAETQVKSSQKQEAIAKGARSPTLSVRGSYGTGYSGARKAPVGDPELEGFDTLGFTATSGEPVVIPSYEQETEQVAFSEQFQDNLNQTVSFSLNIPIFNNWTVNNNISKAKIASEQAQLELETAKNDLRQNIRKAYNDALAAMKKYNASKKAVEAMEESFRYAEIRYEEGLINTVDYSDSKTKLAKAKSDLLQAKFDYIFKTRILKFYKGEPLTFE